MARVSVEQKALTDPRFYRLGLDLGAEPKFAHAVGLFAMVRIWNECIERGKYTLDGWILQAALGEQKAAEHIMNSDLATAAGGNRFRIRGTKGRIEYLEEKRKLARKNGQKGGRPRKPTSVFLETDVGVPGETPLTPALTPALTQKTEEKTAPAAVAVSIPPELDTPEFREAWSRWKADRAKRKIRKYTEDGERTALKRLSRAAEGSPAVAMEIIDTSIANGWQGLFSPKESNHGRSGGTVRSTARPVSQPGRYGSKPAIVAGRATPAPGQAVPNVAEGSPP